MKTNNQTQGHAAAQHTPGPWTITSDNRVFHRTDKVATCADSPQGDANARLIAAAPELLSALIEMVDASERPVAERWLLNVRSHAKAAIARAEEGGAS